MEIVHQKEEVVRALTQSKFNIKSLEFKEGCTILSIIRPHLYMLLPTAEVRNRLLDEELLTESVSLDLTRMEEANKAEYEYQNIIESFFGMVCDQIDYENFKAKNHRRRIISDILLTEYAYFLEPNGRLYTVTGDRLGYYSHFGS